jgi:hypothetical protein
VRERESESGVFLEPDDDEPHARVLVCGGSEGGIPRDLATVLVQEGFACLALGYHGYEGVPDGA